MKRTIPSKTQNNLSCNWEDGQTITLTNHMHRYDSPGFYVATDLWTDHYVLNIFNPVVQINNQSLNYTSLSWNFVNGTSIDGETSLVHTFNDTGSYSAQLNRVNSCGCLTLQSG